MTTNSVIKSLIVLIAISATGLAQDKNAPLVQVETVKQEPLEDGTFKVLGSKIVGANARVVKGAPYSAVGVTEELQTLSDGNQISHRSEAVYYRDSEGRTRIEEQLSRIGKWTAAGGPPRYIMIFDPVASVSYHLDPIRRTAIMMISTSSESAPTPKRIRNSVDVESGYFAKQKRENEESILKRKGEALILKSEGRKIKNASEVERKVSSEEQIRKTESLGTEMIEGLPAEGTRTVLTIPAGRIGNTLPLEIIDEKWYSRALQLTVLSKHTDPRSGVVTWRLTNINRSEPTQSLFEVPGEYKVTTAKPITLELPPIPKPSTKQPFEF